MKGVHARAAKRPAEPASTPIPYGSLQGRFWDPLANDALAFAGRLARAWRGRASSQVAAREASELFEKHGVEP